MVMRYEVFILKSVFNKDVHSLRFCFYLASKYNVTEHDSSNENKL